MKNAEEAMLDELKRTYTQQGVLEPRTPHDKVSSRTIKADEVIRHHHLEIESEIQKYLQHVTNQMARAQAFQGLTYITKEIENLLSGGETSLQQNKKRIESLIDDCSMRLSTEREALSAEIMSSLNAGAINLAQANAALLQARDLDALYEDIKSVKHVLQDNPSSDASQVH